MNKELSLLLLSPDRSWSHFVEKNISLTSLYLSDLCDNLPEGDFSIVLLDASLTSQVVQVVKHILQRYRRSKIIVVAADPSWKETRAVLLAGAHDYLSKSYFKDDLLNSIQRIMDDAFQSE